MERSKTGIFFTRPDIEQSNVLNLCLKSDFETNFETIAGDFLQKKGRVYRL